jgi:hypothetical protein
LENEDNKAPNKSIEQTLVIQTNKGQTKPEYGEASSSRGQRGTNDALKKNETDYHAYEVAKGPMRLKLKQTTVKYRTKLLVTEATSALV